MDYMVPVNDYYFINNIPITNERQSDKMNNL